MRTYAELKLFVNFGSLYESPHLLGAPPLWRGQYARTSGLSSTYDGDAVGAPVVFVVDEGVILRRSPDAGAVVEDGSGIVVVGGAEPPALQRLLTSPPKQGATNTKRRIAEVSLILGSGEQRRKQDQVYDSGGWKVVGAEERRNKGVGTARTI